MAFFDSHQRPLGKNTVLIRSTNYSSVVKPGDLISDKGYMSYTTIGGLLENVDEKDKPISRYI